MDLDSSAYYKLSSVRLGNVNFKEYQRISGELGLLRDRYDYETPEMWCSHIYGPFRKILEENQYSDCLKFYYVSYTQVTRISN